MTAPPPVQPPAPLRFADYFFQCGLNPAARLADRRVLDDGSIAGEVAERGRQASEGVSPGNAMPLPQAKLKKKHHPLEWKYAPEVLCRYPAVDYSDKERFPGFLPMFCFPDNIRLQHADNGPLPETYHSFIITEETGAKCYGVCVTIYEPLHPTHAAELEHIAQELRSGALGTSDLEYIQHIQSQLATNQEALLHARMGIPDPRTSSIIVPKPEPTTPATPDSPAIDTEHTLADAEEKVKLYKDLLAPLNTLLADVENVYVPRCVGVLSHWPWYDFLKDWICEVLRVVRGDYDECPGDKVIVPLERFVVNLIHEIPLPPPGKLELSLHIGQLHLYCSRPPVNTISVLKNFSFYPLFRSLSVPNIIILFELALAEQKIIFVSSHLAMLTLAAESLCLLFFPLFWQHILIPVLPERLLSYLQAPMPYIVGVGRGYFANVEEEGVDDANVVDLDNDTITLSTTEAPPSPLPPRERRKLITRLEKASGIHTGFSPYHRPPSFGHNGSGKQRTDKGVPLTVQYAMPLGKCAPRCCETARRIGISQDGRKVIGRSRAQSEIVGAGRNRMPGGHGGAQSPVGGWMDKLNKHLFSQSSVGLGAGGAGGAVKGSTFSLSSGSSAEEARGLWWGPGSQENPGGDRRKSLDRESMGSSVSRSPGRSILEELDGSSMSSPEKPSPTSSESGLNLNARLRKPFFGRKSENLKPSASTTSLTSMFTSLTSNSTSSPRSVTTPPTIPPSRTFNAPHRLSVSAQSTTSSTASSSFFSQYSVSTNFAVEASENPNVVVKRQEGHGFYAVGVKSPWSDVDKSAGSLGVAQSSSGSFGVEEKKEEEGDEDKPLSTFLRGGGKPRFSLKKSGSRKFGADSGESVVSRRKSTGARSGVSVNTQVQQPIRSGMGNLPIVTLELGSVCGICREELVNAGDTVVLQCEACNLKIHPACIPITDAHPCPTSFSPHRIQLAFLKLFTSLLRDYRSYLATPDDLQRIGAIAPSPLSESKRSGSLGSLRELDMDALEGVEWFRKEEFLSNVEKDAKIFMAKFCETQAFSQFMLDRIERPESDYEVLFFDECIKEKRNRSKLKLGKSDTPFLNETSFDVRSTVVCLEPSSEGCEGVMWGRERVPIVLEEELLGKKREVQSLVTVSDHRMMRSMTNELVQRARMANNMKRKQDFSKWMRGRWKHFQKVGGGEVVSLGFLSDEQRRELFEQRLNSVNNVIDTYEQLHLSSQPASVIRKALQDLHAQNMVLMTAADEEQLVDAEEQEVLAMCLGRLMRVITIYEDYLAGIKEEDTVEQDRGKMEKRLDESMGKLELRVSFGPEFGSVSDWLRGVGVGGSAEGSDVEEEVVPEDGGINTRRDAGFDSGGGNVEGEVKADGEKRKGESNLEGSGDLRDGGGGPETWAPTRQIGADV